MGTPQMPQSFCSRSKADPQSELELSNPRAWNQQTPALVAVREKDAASPCSCSPFRPGPGRETSTFSRLLDPKAIFFSFPFLFGPLRSPPTKPSRVAHCRPVSSFQRQAAETCRLSAAARQATRARWDSPHVPGPFGGPMTSPNASSKSKLTSIQTNTKKNACRSNSRSCTAACGTGTMVRSAAESKPG